MALFKGITAKGLLLASLPLMLTPMLSYLLTPVVIPITATTVAGRRKRQINETDSEWKGVPLNGTAKRPIPNWTSSHVPDKKLAEAKVSAK